MPLYEKLLSGIFLAALAFLPLSAEAGADFEVLQPQFIAAERGDEAKIPMVERGFAELVKVEPENPVFRVYHGSSVAMQSRTTLVPWKKTRWVDEGLAEIDAALKTLKAEHEKIQLRGVPVALEAKLVAAGTFLALPGFYEREDAAAKLLDSIRSSAAYQGTPKPFKAAVLLRAAELSDAQGNDELRKRQLEEAVMFDPNGTYGGRASALLASGD